MHPSALADARSTSPLAGVIICFTSIQVYERENLATIAANLGATTTYDLTKATTHLLVGSYDTPKYRHVARSRPDIRAMDACWVYAVRDAWRADEFDFDMLEKKYELKALETGGVPTGETVDVAAGAADTADAPQRRPALKICLTGVEDLQERAEIRRLIESGGAIYTGELNRSVTHLLVSRPSGSKYDAARLWNIPTVSLLWLTQSLKRGMILDEKYFNPLLPADQQGVAFDPSVPTKRKLADFEPIAATTATTAAPETKLRKLRKTASLKLGSQQASVWTSILGASAATNRPIETADSSFAEPADIEPTADEAPETEPSTAPSPQEQQAPAVPDATAIFAGCAFYIHGFESKKMRVARQAVTSRGALVGESVEATSRLQCAGPKFALVPQDTPWASLAAVHASRLVVVTECFVERCLFKKKLFDPIEHVVGRPFPVFPIARLVGLRVHTSGFSGIDLLHVQRTLEQLGAVVEENFSDESAVLVLHSLASARREKLASAVKLQMPIVSADWLWACVEEGEKVPFESFYFRELQGVAYKKRHSLRRSRAESRLERGELREKTGGPLFDVSESALNKAAAADVARDKADATREKAGAIIEKADATIGKTIAVLEKRAANASFLRAVMEDQEEEEEEQEKQGEQAEQGEEEQEQGGQREEDEPQEPARPKAQSEPNQAEPKQAEAKQDAKAQQRKALSDQLFNLMTATTISDDVCAITAPDSAPAVIEETPTECNAADALKKRTRRAFGRNISGASVYSEVEAAPREPAAGSAGAAAAAAVEGDDSAEQEADDAGKETETDGKDKATFAPTQVEYRDPEAAKVRAVLLSRLEGGEEAKSGGGSGSGRGRRK